MKPTIIKTGSGWDFLRLREVWEYRELLYFLVWKDIKVKYKQTIIGVAWAVIQPLFTMVIFSLFFGRLARIPSEGIPYPIFAYCALVPWTYFANSLTNATNSIVEYQRVITKVYFPRVFLPLASVLENMIDFFIAFIVLMCMMFFYRISPTNRIWMVPIFFILAMLTALGVGLWLSALNVQYRDVRYTMNFLIQLWLFATPVVYPASIVPDRWRIVYGLNPMVGVIEGFRMSLLGKTALDIKMVTISFFIVVLIFVGGFFYFRRMERTFADIV